VTDQLRSFKSDIFKALANPTRIAILDVLAQGERSAGALSFELEMEQANVSQHLAVLRAKQLVTTRKAGNHVFYSMRAPVVNKILDLMREYFHAHLSDSLAMLSEMQKHSSA